MALLVNIITAVVVLLFTAVIVVVYFLRQRAAQFKRRDVPYIGALLWKNIQSFAGSLSFFDLELDIYAAAKAKKAPIVAFSDYTGQSSFMVMDLDIMKQIMVKDSDHFPNQRPVSTQNSGKYIAKMLFTMRDDPWKAMRSKMTPAFSSGKMKRMYQIFQTSSEKQNEYIKKEMGYPTVKSMDVDFSKVLFKYSMDVIASCAFGVDSQSWTTSMNEFSTFAQNGKNFEFQFGPKEILKLAATAIAPKLADFLDLDILDAKSQQYFANVIKQVLKHRRETGQRENDFLQLMMDIQKGVLKAEEENGAESKTAVKIDFDDEHLVANALMFFLGGFDTTQSVLLFSVYSLALEHQCQEKLYQEAMTTMEKHGGKLSYEAILEMPYLEMVIYETLRIYPAASRTERECSQDYVVKETGLTIRKGEMVVFPAHGVHHDEDYYPQPEKFIPERFSHEERAARNPYTFLSFGHGPRSCIGMRFAMLKVKAVLAQLISEFQLDVCSQTAIPMEFAATDAAKPANGMWLKVTARE